MPPQARGPLLRTETRLGAECGNAPLDALPALRLEQGWKPGRFMRDTEYDVALATQLTIERCDTYLGVACPAMSASCK